VEASAFRRRDPRSAATRVLAFAFLNRSFTERLPIAAGGMLGSYPKEVAMVSDEQLLIGMVLWSWVVFVLWTTPANCE
jgi:hypothetical protein